MKNLFYTGLAALVLSGCANAKREEQEAQKQVMDIHEKVMADDEKAMKNKMRLDTVLHIADSLKTDKLQATTLNQKLTNADDLMSDWMRNFNPDKTGKNHDDIMKYFHVQLKQIKQIDSLLVNATAESDTYLQKIKVK